MTTINKKLQIDKIRILRDLGPATERLIPGAYSVVFSK